MSLGLETGLVSVTGFCEKKARKLLLGGYDPRGTIDPEGWICVHKTQRIAGLGKARVELSSAQCKGGALETTLSVWW